MMIDKQMDKYIILRDKTIGELQDSVCEYISKGYIPCGGVAYDGNWNRYIQSMVIVGLE